MIYELKEEIEELIYEFKEENKKVRVKKMKL